MILQAATLIVVQQTQSISVDVEKVRNDISTVERDIKLLNELIMQTDTDVNAVKKLKEVGWEVELAALRLDKQQLRAQAGQLRAQKVPLREQELVLLKADAH
jgi:hypothetical protein